MTPDLPLDEAALKAAQNVRDAFRNAPTYRERRLMFEAVLAYAEALAQANRPQASETPSTDPLASAIQTACNSAAKAPDEYCTWAMATAAADGVRSELAASDEDVERVARAICCPDGCLADRMCPSFSCRMVNGGGPYRKTARAAIAAMGNRVGEESLLTDSWWPIETAPKDGTEILACSVEAGTNVMMVRHIAMCDFLTDAEIATFVEGGADDEMLEEPDWFAADFLQGERLSPDCYPTHWMPLPPLPAPPSGDQN